MNSELLVVGGQVLARADGEPRPAFRAMDILVIAGRIEVLADPGAIPHTAALEVLDASGRLILPGLVNAHSHSYGQVCRHCFNDDALEPWLPRAIAYARGMTADDAVLAARLHAADALRFGVTTLLDHARLQADHLDGVVESYEQAGIRVALAPQISDRPLSESVPLLDAYLDSRIRGADRWQASPTSVLLDLMNSLLQRVDSSRLVTAVVGPSSVERSTPELLTALSNLARDRDLAVHTHLLETRVQRKGGDPLRTLDEAGLLGSRTTLAHAVYLDAADRERLARAGATVIHNPMSNLATGAGYFDLPAALAAGVHVAFGSDGFNCGGSQDLLAALRIGVSMSRPQLPSETWIKPSAVWWMATEGAATAVGLGDITGRLAPGYEADFLIVDPALAGCYEGPDWLDQLVFAGFGFGLERVYVAGKLVAQQGRPVNLDERRLATEAAAAYGRIQRSTSADQEVAAAMRPYLSQMVELAAGRRKEASSGLV